MRWCSGGAERQPTAGWSGLTSAEAVAKRRPAGLAEVGLTEGAEEVLMEDAEESREDESADEPGTSLEVEEDEGGGMSIHEAMVGDVRRWWVTCAGWVGCEEQR